MCYIILVWFFQLLLFQNIICDFKDDPWYPRYHLASLNGFMNDPNGMIFSGGRYHGYYQHTPNNVSAAGLKHWAHVTSDNMLGWHHENEALTPSIPDDIDGCYSGSAVTDKNDNMFVLYTGVSTVGNRSHQVQCLADSWTGGYTFRKQGKVIESQVYFENFRDPKVWRDGDQYYVVVGAMNETGQQKRGQVMLYKSQNLQNWTALGILAGPLNNTGFMWECPDMYPVGDKHILSFSIQEEKADGSVGYRSGYLVGSWTEGKPFQIEKDFTDFDKGHDFYASQTFLAKDGRRIQVAWMNMWDTPFPEAARGWVGCLTLPRELTLSPAGNLLINPIREVESYRLRMNYHLSLKVFEDQKKFLIENRQVDGPTYELEMNWDIQNSNATAFGVELTGTPDGEGFFLFVLKNESQLVLRRNYPQYGFPLNDKFLKIDPNSTLYTRIFFDYSTVEVFINHGETVMSSRIYPTAIQRNLALFTMGGDAVFNDFREWYILAQ